MELILSTGKKVCQQTVNGILFSIWMGNGVRELLPYSLEEREEIIKGLVKEGYLNEDWSLAGKGEKVAKSMYNCFYYVATC